MAIELKAEEASGLDPLEDQRVKGRLWDMWGLYQQLSSNPPNLLSLTIYDYLSARDGLPFPDFFKAVRTFIRENCKERPNLEEEIGVTFHNMESGWDSYGPFFEKHPELRYFGHLNFFGYQVQELEHKFPFLRSVSMPQFRSLQQYHRLRGNLEVYVSLDQTLSKNPDIGTLFEMDGGNDFGEVFVYLRPYGNVAEGVAAYLPLLKHGDLIGFGSVAIAQAGGKQFVAVTSLQTDLLRKDYVAGARPDVGTKFSLPEMKRNKDGRYTVPKHLRKEYLSSYALAHKMASAVEAAAVELSEKFDIRGVIIPTLSTHPEGQKLAATSGYAAKLYEAFPEERGYQKQALSVVFPLTDKEGEGRWWVAPIEKLKAKRT